MVKEGEGEIWQIRWSRIWQVMSPGGAGDLVGQQKTAYHTNEGYASMVIQPCSSYKQASK